MAAPASDPVAAVVPVRADREAVSADPEPVAWDGGRAAEREPVPAGTDRASAVPVLGKAVPATATAGSAQVGPVRAPGDGVRVPVRVRVASAVRPARAAGRAPVA
ncbi:hypothetical protein [Micromonospora sp. NPDC000442]|uniref:hypothetical protein n=1 Tax=Micromonospora sp. NPDC000442 TaxID=3364217 RepID=UPI0036C350DB